MPISRKRRKPLRAGATPSSPGAFAGRRKPSLREQAKLRTRDAIVDAALASFSAEGLDAPSLDAICARAGCTRGAFYVHFKDRDDLIAAAMERRRRGVVARLLSSSAEAVSILEALDLFASAVEAGLFPVPGAVRTAELVAACRRSSIVRKAQLKLVRQTLGYVEKAVDSDRARGRLRTDVDAASLSLLLLCLEAGAEVLLDTGYPLDVRRAVQAIARLMGA